MSVLPKLDVPTYEATLTSTGKKIKFRPFLVKEQKLFLMASESNEPEEVIDIIKQVLNNCIITPDVDVNEIPIFDLEYLFLQLRARSVSEVVNLRYTCNNNVQDEKGEQKKCNGIFKLNLNLLDIKPEKNPDHKAKIEITPKLGIVMKYPNFKMIGSIDTENESESLLKVIVSCIDYIYDADNIYYAKDVSQEEMIEFVENLQQVDFQKIQDFFQTIPKISRKEMFKCPKCGYQEEMLLEGVQSFFE